jgi:hypothetical protein
MSIAHGDTVILDYSHAEGIPALRGLLLTVRGSSVLQLLLGLALIGGILAWEWWSHATRNEWLRSLPPSKADPPNVDRSGEDIRAHLQAEHPDWDDEKIDRLTKAVNSQRENTTNNE